MKRIGRKLLYLLLGLIGFVLVYWLADGVLSRIPAHTASNQEPTHTAVYVWSNGVHTDLIFPVKHELMEWSSVFPYTHTRSGDTAQQFVAIGWGDKGFYLNTPEWKDLTLKTALVAVSGLGETALHVTYYNQISENAYCYKTMVTEQQYRQLVNYVLENVETDEHGTPVYIQTDAQYGDTDAFYEAKGAYHLFFSCNTWTNRALKKANMPSGMWTVFDKGILRHYRQ